MLVFFEVSMTPRQGARLDSHRAIGMIIDVPCSMYQSTPGSLAWIKRGPNFTHFTPPSFPPFSLQEWAQLLYCMHVRPPIGETWNLARRILKSLLMVYGEKNMFVFVRIENNSTTYAVFCMTEWKIVLAIIASNFTKPLRCVFVQKTDIENLHIYTPVSERGSEKLYMAGTLVSPESLTIFWDPRGDFFGDPVGPVLHIFLVKL